MPGAALGFGVVLVDRLGGRDGRWRSIWSRPALLALSIAFYVFVYTIWLKRRTPQNIVIGGAAGAFPPMIGWAAVTGDVCSGRCPCSRSSSSGRRRISGRWRCSAAGDYERAGVPMLPVVVRRARDQAADPALHAAACAAAPRALAARLRRPGLRLSAPRCSACHVAGAASRVWRDTTASAAAKRLFGFSLLYLFLCSRAAGLDRVVARLWR